MASAGGQQGGSSSGSSTALQSIDEAFTAFRASVSSDHARQFRNTTLHDVWAAAREVENKLAAQQASRHMKRIQPFLNGLEHYSKAVEILCNGTPYLPWVWAPIKLCLIIASDFVGAFEKLMKAYSQIAEALPRFDRLAHTLKEKPEFQSVLALVYCDIIEFHHRAYRMFNFPAWKRFFDTSWKRFDTKFAAVLESLGKHTDLIDKEASAYGIASVFETTTAIQDVREKIYEEANFRAQARSDREFEAVLAWLDVQDHVLEDDFARLKEKSLSGTCDWFLKHKAVARWISAPPKTAKESKLWIYGKPGSGKSTLSVNLIDHLRGNRAYSTVYYLCSYQSGSRNDVSCFLRSVVRQLLRLDGDLAAHVYDGYIRKGASPSVNALKGIVVELVSCSAPVRIVLDGVDECTGQQQKELLKLLIGITEDAANGGNCKAAIFSRDVEVIHKQLVRYPGVSLKEEKCAVDQAIRRFVRHEIASLRYEQDDLPGSDTEYRQLEDDITLKADGMFLWASLVLCSLENVYSIRQLKSIVEGLPPGLDNAYRRIVDRIQTELAPDVRKMALSILTYVAFAERPLFHYEVLGAIAVLPPDQNLNVENKLRRGVLDLGKPLVEIAQNETVTFVHFTVKEFLLSHLSGPLLSIGAAHREISLACVWSIQRSLDLLDPSIEENTKLQWIAGSLLGFNNYSLNHWTRHLHLYVERISSGTGKPECQDMLAQSLYQIATRHDALLLLLDKPALENVPGKRQIHTLEVLCDSANFVRLVKALEEETESAPVIDTLNATTAQASAPKTAFPDVRRRFDTLMHTLTTNDNQNLPGIDPILLADFRAAFGSSAFHCNVRGCSRENVAFPTLEARDRHIRDHKPRIFCTESSCPLSSAIGFRSGKDLKRHLVRYHSTRSARLPKFRIGSRRSELTTPEPPVMTIEDAPGMSKTNAFPSDMDFANIDSGDVLDNIDFDFLYSDDPGLTFDANFNFSDEEPYSSQVGKNNMMRSKMTRQEQDDNKVTLGLAEYVAETDNGLKIRSNTSVAHASASLNGGNHGLLDYQAQVASLKEKQRELQSEEERRKVPDLTRPFEQMQPALFRGNDVTNRPSSNDQQAETSPKKSTLSERERFQREPFEPRWTVWSVH